MHSQYYIPACSAKLPYAVDVTPESAGWSEASLWVVELTPGQELALNTNDIEVMILPLAGGGTVDCDGQMYELTPRASVSVMTLPAGSCVRCVCPASGLSIAIRLPKPSKV